MNANREFDVNGYREDIGRNGFNDRVLDIDAALAIADENNRWTEEFLEQATVKAKKAYLRKLHRNGMTDEDGRRIEWLNIVEIDEETGEARQGYKQMEFFTLDNFEYAIRQCKRRVQSEQREYRRLCRAAIARFGDSVQQRFDFKLPAVHVAA